MTYYFVANENGGVIDKDGYDPKRPEYIGLSEFTDYAYETEANAEAYVEYYDPEGRAGLHVISRQVEFDIYEE